MDSDKKTCPVCYMEIPLKAKKCPYCQHWQDKLHTTILNPLFTTGLAIVFVIGMMILMGLFFDKIFSSGESFQNHKDSLAIAHNEMKFGEKAVGGKDGKYPTVAILGDIENKSDISWKDIVIETQFFDKQGQMIDSKHMEDYSMVIPAHGKAAFKVSFEMEFPKDQYETYKASILSAKDCAGRF